MIKKIYAFFGAVTILCLLAALPALRNARGDDDRDGLHLRGAYAFQFNGSVFLPAPFSAFDGPFSRNGRFTADGHGNFQVTSVVANYAGVVSRDTFAGTYVVQPDGTFVMRVVNLPVPFLPPGTPNIFTFDGVLAEGGKSAKVVLSGVNVGGSQLPNIGSVISGEFVRQ